MIKTATGFIKWWLGIVKFAAITLPPFGIYVLFERINDERLIKHEMKHWEQYQKMGFFKFYLFYAWYSLRYGYTNNPMEIEARKAECWHAMNKGK